MVIQNGKNAKILVQNIFPFQMKHFDLDLQYLKQGVSPLICGSTKCQKMFGK